MDPVFFHALERIPPQLRVPEARFTIIPPGQKSPVGKAWGEPGGANYGYGDPTLAAYLASGWNYGVVTGLSRLAVVDIDNLEEAQDLISRLPETFTIRTGSGGQHHYYKCPAMKRISFYHANKLVSDGSPLHIGEAQAEGQQVVGPGSLHRSLNRYKVIKDLPINSIVEDDIIQALNGFKLSRAKKCPVKEMGHEVDMPGPADRDGLLLGSLIPIDSLARPRGQVAKCGDEIRGTHPLHPSESGTNFAINRRANVWHCWRHETGGGPLEFLAMTMGLLDCADVRPGCLKGIFGQVVDEARQMGYALPGVRR
jgi:hypothetical protein